MVNVIKSGELQPFKGTVDLVEVVDNEKAKENDAKQYHMTIKPEDENMVKGPTGRMHNYISISKTVTDDAVPEESVLQKYVTAVEKLLGDKKTHKEVLDSMVGKSFEFEPQKLGRSYKGHDAKDYWVPVSVVDEE